MEVRTAPRPHAVPLEGPAAVLGLCGAAAAFLVSAWLFLAPGLIGTAGLGRTASLIWTAASATPLPLAAAERTLVLSYVESYRANDALVEVRPGVEAKRSNVEGVRLDGRTVYYDVLSHQSFGPLRSGRVGRDDVHILSREGDGPVAVVIYALKR